MARKVVRAWPAQLELPFDFMIPTIEGVDIEIKDDELEITPQRVVYVEFGENGEEVERTGEVWGHAPPVKGMSCRWVQRDGLAVAVARASRRHRVGRSARGRWRRAGGRYVDVGTWYTETAPQSPTGALTAGQRGLPPPTAISGGALDPSVFAMLSGEAPD